MNILKPPTEYAAELYALGLKATNREDSKEIVTGLRKFPGATADYTLEVLNELEELEFAEEKGYDSREEEFAICEDTGAVTVVRGNTYLPPGYKIVRFLATEES